VQLINSGYQHRGDPSSNDGDDDYKATCTLEHSQWSWNLKQWHKGSFYSEWTETSLSHT